jgi:hypothetical protein
LVPVKTSWHSQTLCMKVVEYVFFCLQNWMIK